MEYINAEKLIAEIEKRARICRELSEREQDENPDMGNYYRGKAVSLEEILLHITSLQLEQPSIPSNLDEAANNYGIDIRLGYPRVMDETDKYIYNAFKAGAEWMAGQDKEKIEQAFFSGYNECEDRMKKEFEKRAMAGEVNNTGYPTTIQLHTFDSSLKNGDKVNIIIMKQE